MVNKTDSLKQLNEPKPVTLLAKKIRKDECSKRKESFKREVKRIDDLTTKIQELAEEVRERLIKFPNYDRYVSSMIETHVDRIKESSVDLYEFANDSYEDSYSHAFVFYVE